MGTHVSFIFSGYNPYFGGVKPSFFMVLDSKGIYLEPGDILYFGGWTLQNKAFFEQNRGYLGFRYVYVSHGSK